MSSSNDDEDGENRFFAMFGVPEKKIKSTVKTKKAVSYHADDILSKVQTICRYRMHCNLQSV